MLKKSLNPAAVVALTVAGAVNRPYVEIDEAAKEKVIAAVIAGAIFEEIETSPARSAWQRGVRNFAFDLFNDAVSECGRIKTPLDITEEILLNGAPDWEKYSRDGNGLAYDGQIARALCSPSELRRKKYGALPPNSNEDWFDVQARALNQAARLVLEIVDKYREMFK